MSPALLRSRPSADGGVPGEALAVWVLLPSSTLGSHALGAYSWTLILGSEYPSGRIAKVLPSNATPRVLREIAAECLGLVSRRLPRLLALQSEVIPPGFASPVVCDVQAVVA